MPLASNMVKVGDKVKTDHGIGIVGTMEVNGHHLFRVTGKGFAHLLLDQERLDKYEVVSEEELAAIEAAEKEVAAAEQETTTGEA